MKRSFTVAMSYFLLLTSQLSIVSFHPARINSAVSGVCYLRHIRVLKDWHRQARSYAVWSLNSPVDDPWASLQLCPHGQCVHTVISTPLRTHQLFVRWFRVPAKEHPAAMCCPALLWPRSTLAPNSTFPTARALTRSPVIPRELNLGKSSSYFPPEKFSFLPSSILGLKIVQTKAMKANVLQAKRKTIFFAMLYFFQAICISLLPACFGGKVNILG